MRRSPCPTDELLQLLSRPWTTHILWVLQQQGVLRFGVLRRAVTGISARLLADRLRLLERAGFVHRDYRPTMPPEVYYRLTEKGCDLGQVLGSIDQLARRWRSREEERLKEAAPEALSDPGTQ